ncbi:dehydrogenase/reductase SDR family member on chromosome X homolog [Dermacentor silvarum]|nr:dehydrogenase/reductase SDR family member on chromosome X homolog [Dermacentor silvarum]
MISLINHVVFFVKDMLWLYVLSAYYLLWECLLRIKSQLSPQEQMSYGCMLNKTVLVTGGSGGIGHETIRALLSLGARVIDGSPDTNFNKEQRKHLLLDGQPTAQVELLHLDLSSMASVKTFAENILKSESKLDLLICNAGVMLMPYQETEDGFESHMSINYLGHCLLTALLLPLLIAAGNKGPTARIVNVSSCAHKAARINLDDLHSRKRYSCYHGYTQSKLAQVLFTKSLAKRLQAKVIPVTVNCVHPGIVNTQLYQRVWWAPLVAGLVFKTPEESVKTVLHAALSSELEGISGCYLEECALAQPLSVCNDRSIQERLWNKTWALLKPWLNDCASTVNTLLAS